HPDRDGRPKATTKRHCYTSPSGRGLVPAATKLFGPYCVWPFIDWKPGSSFGMPSDSGVKRFFRVPDLGGRDRIHLEGHVLRVGASLVAVRHVQRGRVVRRID